MDDLVTTGWLAANLGQADLVPVDCSWFMAASGRSGRDEYLAAHIPGARFLDIDALSDPAGQAPHMLPPAAGFGRAMRTVAFFRRHARTVLRTGGAMLVLLGLLQVSGLWTGLMARLQGLILGFRLPL